MKLKQALVIGLSTAVLALPAIAAESAIHLNNEAKAIAPKAMEIPANKEGFHRKKAHKKVSMENETTTAQAKENAKLDELNALSEAAGKDQAEKNEVKS